MQFQLPAFDDSRPREPAAFIVIGTDELLISTLRQNGSSDGLRAPVEQHIVARRAVGVGSSNPQE